MKPFAIAAIIIAAVVAIPHAQSKPTTKPTIVAAAPATATATATTLPAAIDAFEALAKQRTGTQARTTAEKAGVAPVSRDWEIDSVHLVRKSRELSKLTGTARDRKANEVVDHALRLLASDARLGDNDREQETLVAVRGILTAMVIQSNK